MKTMAIVDPRSTGFLLQAIIHHLSQGLLRSIHVYTRGTTDNGTGSDLGLN